MLNSMTGFGSIVRDIPSVGKVTIELRSTNHKFLEILLHVPTGSLCLEEGMRKEIEGALRRGRIVCAVNISGPKSAEVYINEDLVKNYLRAVKNLKNKLAASEELKLETLLNLPGVITVVESQTQKEKTWPHIKSLLREVLQNLRISRRKEGEALGKALKSCAELIIKKLVLIKKRFKKIIPEKIVLLKSDEERSAFVKNSDITEELERLDFHVKNFMQKLSKGSPVGKELDFIAQEMQREANTTGAKSCDTIISGAAVELKSLIEKIREQVQNIE